MGFFRRELMRLCEAQNHRCCFCSDEMNHDPRSRKRATREHIIPKAFGGILSWENAAASCEECNTMRGPIDAMLFFELRTRGAFAEIESARRHLERICEPRHTHKYVDEAKLVPETAWILFERIVYRGVPM